MQFLAPWSLVGLVLVPVVFLWGLLAPRGRRVVVGSLVLWRRALGAGPAGRPSPRVRLRNPLLWLDALIVLFVVLACARPAARTAVPTDPVATVVIDRTASMLIVSEEGPRWQRVYNLAEKVLAHVPAAPIRVVSVPDRTGLTTAKEVPADDALVRSQEFWAPVLAEADVWTVAKAEVVRNPGRPVLVTTDVAPQTDLPPDVHVLACGGVSSNVGLVRVARRVDDDRLWLLVSAKAAAGAPGSYDLVVSSRAPHIRSVITSFVSPGAAVERVVEVGPAVSDELTVALRGLPDGFKEDNSAQFVWNDSRRIRVVMVGAPDAALRRALTARKDTEVLEAPEVTEVAPESADLVIVVEEGLPPRWKGPAAVVAPNETAGPVRPTGEKATADWRVAAEHPLADALYLEPPRLGIVRRYEVAGEARLLLGTPDVPLIVTWESGGIRRLAVLFGFDGQTTDWPRRAGFPIFWKRAVDWLVPSPLSAQAPVLDAATFIGSDEGFQSGPARDDSQAAIEAILKSAEAKRRATLADLWPYLAAAALVALIARAWVAK